MDAIKNLPKVENMQSNNGNDIPNQFIIITNDATIFQSYSSVIAVKTNDKIYLDERKWDYSKTTGKYRNQFLRMDKKQTLQAIESGKIILADLN